MTGQFSEVQKVISTGSDILDAILNDKLGECEEKKISMRVEWLLDKDYLRSHSFVDYFFLEDFDSLYSISAYAFA